jgi:hypothetical protein
MAKMKCGTDEFDSVMAKFLGLPKNVKWFELRVSVDEVVTVKCAYFPEIEDTELVEITNQFDVTRIIEPEQDITTLNDKSAVIKNVG